ncbi:hypothetical protein BG006_007961 [Podila minutissima]|uniref:Glutaredoxin domain-containing protein n=1 Tax=Podila minutissima TaxID=64525 RepID=A0A9P5SRH0_9FUNG|nr:hypothetical protein BG006_007961 [Podila minutissima]
MNLHALLGQKPGSNDITAVLTEVTKGANITGIIPEPDVKIYKDAVYYSYLPLGISFNFEPSTPLSTARNAPKPDPALLNATDLALSPLEARVQGLIDNNKVMVFSKSYCPYSAAAKKLLKSYTPDLHILEVDHESEGAAIKDVLIKITHGHKTFPSIFLQSVSIGGWDNLEAMDKKKELKPRLEAMGVELL